MVKCPKCYKDIKGLNLMVIKIKTIYFDGENFDEDEYLYPTDTTEEWVCPECEEVLDIEDDGEATEFLENDGLKKIVKEKINMIKEKNKKCTK